MLKIYLEYNKGFEWYRKKGIYVKGYIFDNKDNFYENEDLINYFINVEDIRSFKNKIKLANGFFSVIIRKKERIFAGVDKLRSFPLFYSIDGKYISDNPEWIREQLRINKINKMIIEEFKLTGFITGSDTFFDEIKQIQAGEYIYLNQYIKTKTYYSFIPEDYKMFDIRKYFDELYKISENVFKRLIKSVGNKTVVIPLSGGYDSRYIAAMLKKLEYNDVICFSYGKRDVHEVNLSEKVAKKLGFKWIFIEYTDNICDLFFEDQTKKYFEFGNLFVSLPHIQDFFAVLYLKEKNLIPKDSIFVPGHSGDLLGGSHIPEGFKSQKASNKTIDIVYQIFKKHYSLYRLEDKNIKDFIIDRLERQLLLNPEYIIGETLPIIEDWNIKNRQAKFIVNSVRVYEFFGYHWRLPLWDIELTEFWFSVPLKYRKEKTMYDGFLLERVFQEFKIDFVVKSKYFGKKNLIRDMLKKMLPEFFYIKLRTFIFEKFIKSKYDESYFILLQDKILNHLKNYSIKKGNFQTNRIVSCFLLKHINDKFE